MHCTEVKLRTLEADCRDAMLFHITRELKKIILMMDGLYFYAHGERMMGWCDIFLHMPSLLHAWSFSNWAITLIRRWKILTTETESLIVLQFQIHKYWGKTNEAVS